MSVSCIETVTHQPLIPWIFTSAPFLGYSSMAVAYEDICKHCCPVRHPIILFHWSSCPVLQACPVSHFSSVSNLCKLFGQDVHVCTGRVCFHICYMFKLFAPILIDRVVLRFLSLSTELSLLFL